MKVINPRPRKAATALFNSFSAQVLVNKVAQDGGSVSAESLNEAGVPTTGVADEVQETIPAPNSKLRRRYGRVRRFFEKLCETLEPEGYVIQTMLEASPTKWHLAHTRRFFETFVLKQFFRDRLRRFLRSGWHSLVVQERGYRNPGCINIQEELV